KGCVGAFDWENENKKRGEIEELDISGEELEGKLDLEGFNKLKYLICRNNKLTKIDLKDCPKLVGIDCEKNELNELIFSNNQNEKLNLKEFRGSDNKFSKLKAITDYISSETLTYLNINDNNISNAEISEFNQFSNLENLYIGNTEERGSNHMSNHLFTGYLGDLSGLKKLLEIDIRYNGIEVKDDFLTYLKNDRKLLGKLEKIYWVGERSDYKQYYEDNFYDVKALRQKKSSRTIIRSIVKSPLLSEDKNYKVNRIKDDYSMKKEYYKNSKLIYPSESETGEIYKMKDQVPQLENNSLGSGMKKNIRVKRRIECADDAKHYAILSYSWGESAEERLSPGGVKSLDKAIQTLKILNKHHISRMTKGNEIEYL
ncbi:12387_t:CDS:2, partial [Funneliformis geosporum]